MREWSERHIRELVRQEYNRMGGGDDYFERLNDLLTHPNLGSRYTIDMLDNVVSAIEINSDFDIDNFTLENFTAPALTSAARARLTTDEAYIYDAQIAGKTFFKAHLVGTFKHNYLLSTGGLTEFYQLPNFYVTSDSITNDYRFPAFLSLVDLLSYEPDNDTYYGYCYYLTDKNNSSRKIKFFHSGDIWAHPEIGPSFSVEWASGGPYYYTAGRMPFEYDTFIYRGDLYYIYKKTL